MIFWLMNFFMWSEGNFDLQSRWSCDECWSRFYTRKFNIFFWKLLVHMWKYDICLWKANFVSWSDERSHPDTFLKSSSGNFLKKHLIASSSLSSWLQSAVVTSLLQTHGEKWRSIWEYSAEWMLVSGLHLEPLSADRWIKRLTFFKTK